MLVIDRRELEKYPELDEERAAPSGCTLASPHCCDEFLAPLYCVLHVEREGQSVF